MPLEVTVGTTCHVFVVQIESIIESPKQGDFMVCPTCGKTSKILKVGIPHRIDQEEPPASENQKSLFKE